MRRYYETDPTYRDWVDKETTEYKHDGDELDKRIATSFPNLTVKDLKKALENLPDHTPILYQRIEDRCFEEGGWKTFRFIWEYEGEYSDYILAFSAYETKSANGRKVFVINAHY